MVFAADLSNDTMPWPLTYFKVKYYSQSKSSVHNKLHELQSHFPPIAERILSIITSSCWKSTDRDVGASCIDRKKRRVQNVTGSFAQSIRNEYESSITATYNLKNKCNRFWCWNHNDKLSDVSTSTYSFLLKSYKFLIIRASEHSEHATSFDQYRMLWRH